MNGLQLLILAVLALLFVASMTALFRGWSSRREGIVWCSLCGLAALATLWPQLTVKVAHALGIGRGADLVFYCAVVLMMIGFWMTYIRLRHLRRDMTLLVRHLALLEAQARYATGKSDDDLKKPSAPNA